MKNKVALASLAMDLKRVALGLHRHSYATAARFSEEARKRISEVNTSSLPPYLKKIMAKLDKVLLCEQKDRIAEDALMYSTIIQNHVLCK